MIIDWTRNLETQEEKESFEKKLLASKEVLKRLEELIDERLRSIEASERTIKDFETPNWSEKQAFRNGFYAASHIYKRLIDLDQQKGT